MLSLLNPLTTTRMAVTGIIGTVRLGGAAVRGSAALAGRLAGEALEMLNPSSAPLDRRDFRGPSERGLVEEPLEVPVAPRAPRARQRSQPGRPQRGRRRPPAPPRRTADVEGPAPPIVGETISSPMPAASSQPASARERAPEAAHAAPAPERVPDVHAEPAHVSEEPRLAGEFADRAAQDGAGAQVHVEEPWSGYAKLRAREVVDRLVAEPEAVLALVQLYERAHRGRRTVLEAAERELVRRSPPRGGNGPR